MDTTTSSLTPYMVKAFHEWMTDNNLTPYITVNELHPDLIAPPHISNDGVITFNISYNAVQHLFMDNEVVSFDARFSGIPQSIVIPMAAIMSIYARETGVGTEFGMPVIDDVKPKIKELLDKIYANVPPGVGAKSKFRLSNDEMDEVLEKGAEWAVEQGYGTKDDLEKATKSKTIGANTH